MPLVQKKSEQLKDKAVKEVIRYIESMKLETASIWLEHQFELHLWCKDKGFLWGTSFRITWKANIAGTSSWTSRAEAFDSGTPFEPNPQVKKLFKEFMKK